MLRLLHVQGRFCVAGAPFFAFGLDAPRAAMPLERCFDIIREGCGRDFDPTLAAAFLCLREQVTAIREGRGEATV